MPPVKVDPAKVHAFVDARGFEKWMRAHWQTETEVWLKLHKLHTSLPSITPAEAIDVALCWGWIDAIRKSLDATSYLQRYTPRGKKSVWSQVNVANVERLTAAGRMQPSGLAQVEAAKTDGRWAAAYRMKKSEPPPELLAAIRASKKASAMYETLSAQNRFSLTFRVLALKTEEARKRKIAAFVAMLEAGETIYPQAKAPTKKAASKPRSKR